MLQNWRDVQFALQARATRYGVHPDSEAGGPFIKVNRLDLAKYGARPHLSRVLRDYMLYFEHNNHALKQPDKEASHQNSADLQLPTMKANQGVVRTRSWPDSTAVFPDK